MLKCSVPYCKNTNKNTEGITFHVFPTKPILRAAWLRLLNKKEVHVSEQSVVCSKHFLFTDFIKADGIKKLRQDALPSVVQVCMICLDTDSRLMSMSEYKLTQAYEDLTGLILCKEASLCVECATRLSTFKTFRDKSLRANSLIAELVEKHKILRIQDVKTVNRDNYNLKSSLAPASFKPNHCDLFIVEYMEDEPQPEEINHDKITDSAQQVVAHEEQNGYAFIDDYIEIEYMEDEMRQDYEDIPCADIKKENVDEYAEEPKNNNVKNEDNSKVPKTVYLSSDNVWMDQANENVYESDVLVSGITSEGQEIVVKKPHSLPNYGKALKCPMCVKVFLDEKMFSDHVKTHKQANKVRAKYPPTSTTQRQGSLQQKSSRHENKYLHDNNINQHLKVVKTERSDDIEENNKVIIYNLQGDKTFVIDNNTLIKTEDEINTHVLTYDIPTTEEVNTAQLMGNDQKDINRDFDQNSYQVFSYNVVDSANLKENSKPNKKRGVRKQKRVVSYDVHKDNIIIDTFESNVSENDVFMDRINFNENSGSNETEINEVETDLIVINEDKPYCCHVCSKRFELESTLQSHMMIHTGEKPFACKYCDFKSTHRGSIERHEMIHTSKKQFPCHLCSKVFPHSRGLIVHLKTHNGEKPYSCGECNLKFAEKVNLDKHMKIHTGERPFACRLCDFNSAHRRSLLAHERTHTGEKPFICEICGYRSRSQGLLLKHCKTHKESESSYLKLFKCDECDKTFTSKFYLKSHMNMHTGENMFACHYCGKKFAIKSNLVLHLRTHTGEKPYTCEICQYKFSKQTNYQRHWKTHTGEKPYACPICPYRSTQSNTLRCHMRIHTGEKPFACELCSYRATERRSLQNHMKTHSDEAPSKRQNLSEISWA